MAINKTIETASGVNADHHVVKTIHVDRKSDRIFITIQHYANATKFNNGKADLDPEETYKYDISLLPASVKSQITDLRAALEQYLIDTATIYQGGTRVKDNGNPL